MFIAGQIVGIFAVLTFVLSYQFKKRKSIIAVNATSSFLYVLQYVLLGALEGAAIDVLSAVSTVAAHQKQKMPKILVVLIVIAIDGAMVLSGVLLYKDVFSLFPVAGAILQSTAFWINDEKYIRLVSFCGGPFWLVYNITSHAYGAVAGSILSLVSISVAIVRYDVLPILGNRAKTENNK